MPKHILRNTVVTLSTLVVMSGLAFTPAVSAQGGLEALRETEEAFVSIAEDVFPAVVNIRAERRIELSQSPAPNQMREFFERFFGNPGPNMPFEFRERDEEVPERRQEAGGSGFIVSSDGYIITNHHVIDGADTITVTLNDRSEYEAEIIGSDADYDIGVLKIDASGLPALSLGDSESIRVGQWAIAVGSPFGLNHSMTTGIISSTGRGIGITRFDDLIQTDAAINPGNSGGPLLNLNGEVIGINTAIFSRTGGYMGIGFAVPANSAKAIYTQLKETGTVSKGFIGIRGQDITQELMDAFELSEVEGIVITQVTEDSPADLAGLQVGDVITTLNGEPVTEFITFASRVAINTPGTEIELGIVREGRERTMSLTLGDRAEFLPNEGADSNATDQPEMKKEMGFSIQTMTEDLATEFGFDGLQGVLVTDVDRTSEAYNRGVRSGMLIAEVNRTPVRTVEDFNRAVEDASDRGSVLLLVKTTLPAGDVISRFLSVPIASN